MYVIFFLNSFFFFFNVSLISETTLSYSRLQSELNQVVIKMVLQSYGIEKYYETLEKSCFYLMRFIKYRNPKINETNTGLRAHVDKTFLSIIASNQVKGLEIENKNGEWMSFQPSPFTFLVLCGEIFTVSIIFNYYYL